MSLFPRRRQTGKLPNSPFRESHSFAANSALGCLGWEASATGARVSTASGEIHELEAMFSDNPSRYYEGPTSQSPGGNVLRVYTTNQDTWTCLAQRECTGLLAL